MAAITSDDIDRAVAILRRWREKAQLAGKKQAQDEVEHVMRVVDGLYGGGK